MALILRRRGIERVRPLAGGFHGWRERGYPVTPLPAPSGAGSGAQPAASA